MNRENPVGWFEIYVDDIDRAKSFYETVFDTTLSSLPTPTDEEMIMLTFPMTMEEKGGASGAIIKMKDMPAGGNSTLVYFSSEDCSIEESRVEESGGKVLKPKTSIGEHGFISIASDTEGNMIGIHSMK